MPAASPPGILVVDDDRDTRELYRAFFDTSGFRTAEAGEGTQALALAQRLRPDVVLTDLILPDIDGISLARRLKARAETACIRVILVTGFGSENMQREAAAAGVTRALLKPCLPHTMLREVQRALKHIRP